jgi:phage host-nuclease inhibitor protein Gam
MKRTNQLPVITSTETLDAAAADRVRRRIELTQAKADMEAECAAVEKQHGRRIAEITDDCAAREAVIREYCETHAAAVFPEKKKSRETTLCVFGFRLSTRLETANRKIKWGDVVERLQRLAWGEAFLTYKPPVVNKEAFHAARETLLDGDLAQAGVRFVTEDAFYLEPKPETAAPGNN